MGKNITVSDIISSLRPEMKGRKKEGRKNVPDIVLDILKFKTETDKKHNSQYIYQFISAEAIKELIKKRIHEKDKKIEQNIKELKKQQDDLIVKYFIENLKKNRGGSNSGTGLGDAIAYWLKTIGNQLTRWGYEKLLKVKKEIENQDNQKEKANTKIVGNLLRCVANKLDNLEYLNLPIIQEDDKQDNEKDNDKTKLIQTNLFKFKLLPKMNTNKPYTTNKTIYNKK